MFLKNRHRQNDYKGMMPISYGAMAIFLGSRRAYEGIECYRLWKTSMEYELNLLS